MKLTKTIINLNGKFKIGKYINEKYCNFSKWWR